MGLKQEAEVKCGVSGKEMKHFSHLQRPHISAQ